MDYDTIEKRAEQYRKKPIFGADFSKSVAGMLEDVRKELVTARGHLYDIGAGYPGMRERVQDVEGLLTCGLISLAYYVDEQKKIHANDSKDTAV